MRFDNGGRRVAPILALAAAARLGISPAAARELPFPPAPQTAVAAANTLDARRDAVLEFNGCGREGHFNEFLRQVRSDNRDSQGGDLSAIIIAKIYQYLKGGCRFEATLAGIVEPPVLDQSPSCALVSFQQTAGPPAVTQATVTIDRPCLRRQINEALMSYRRHGQLGSSNVPCLPVTSGANPFDSDYSFLTKGEYDTNVRELIRILYLGGGVGPLPQIELLRVLDAATIEHFWKELLTVRGAPGPESYSPVYDCGNREEELGLPGDYADRQDWIDRAIDDLGDAAKYLLKRWLFVLALYLTGPLGGLVHAGLPFVPPIALPPVLGFWAAEADPFPFARVPETENHLLMIETSRFLTNQAMLADLEGHSNADVVRDQQEETREWLLKRLQGIARKDFEEYNSRPYQAYSINSVVNLHDLSTNSEVQTAARIVLDYGSAKTAVGSDRARRYAPFRRLAENDGYDPALRFTGDLYNRLRGADHQSYRLLFLAGQTQLAATPDVFGARNDPASGHFYRSPLFAGKDLADHDAGGVANLVNVATSSYRLPDPILEIAVERPPLFQKIRHVGAEAYSSAPSFLLTAGGVKAPPANTTYGFGRDVDRGIAVPTTLMPTDLGLAAEDLIRFEGVGIGADRTSQFCLEDGFACGTNVKIPGLYDGCKDVIATSGETWTFINTARCPMLGVPGADPARKHFYAAIAVRGCFFYDGICDEDGPGSYGILEVRDAPGATATADAAYDAFRASRPLALQWPVGPSGTYRTSDGRLIGFDIKGATIDDLGGIHTLNGAVVSRVSNWFFLARGTVIDSQGDGLIEIRSPLTGKTLKLDYRDWKNPTWWKSY